MAEDSAKIEEQFPELIKQTGHSEIWGISLSEPSPQRKLVAKKYFTAHKTVELALEKIKATLEWRKAFNPTACITESHDDAKFKGLGYVTAIDPAKASEGIVKTGGAGRKAVITWNIYGAVKDHAKTFGDVDEFLRWRVALMERGIQALDLTDSSRDAPSDDIAIVQVHDYLNVSFFRLPAETKAATKKTIDTLSAHYPEMLSRKYFVNVPIVMGWLFTATKALLAKETVAKFQVLSYGSYVAAELGTEVPKDYGGEGGKLEEQDLKVNGVKTETATQAPVATNTATETPTAVVA